MERETSGRWSGARVRRAGLGVAAATAAVLPFLVFPAPAGATNYVRVCVSPGGQVKATPLRGQCREVRKSAV